MEVRSEGTDKGSEFVVRLPTGRGTAERPASRDDGKGIAAKRLRVLVADDNDDSAQTCAMLLELWGHEVRTANNGEDALAVAEQFRPEVALLDIGMPQLNGYEVAERLRQCPWGKDATLIAVTGWGQEDDKQQANQAGFDHHLTKPVDPGQLQPLIESVR